VPLAVLLDDLLDVGDNVASALDANGIADVHVLRFDLLGVVQARPRHRDAADVDRLEQGDGVSRPVRPTCTATSTMGVTSARAGNL